MLKIGERLFQFMLDAGLPEIRESYIRMVAMQRDRVAAMRDIFVEVEADAGAVMTDDGREILRADGKKWALLPELHNSRRVAAIAAAKERASAARTPEAKAVPGEALTSVLCPSCHAVMAKQPVCPSCAKGKAGFKILCVCTECGHEVYL